MMQNQLPLSAGHRVLGLLLLAATAGTCGCRSVHWNKADFDRQEASAAAERKKKNRKGETFGTPVKLAVVWRDGVFDSDRGPSTRGIGGRVFFYDQSDKPIRAEGELIIYAFDDTANPDSSAADRKYVFTQDKLQEHFGESALGPSYNIWIPWDVVGGEQKSISLIPMFKTPDGRIVKGFQGLVVLQDPTGKSKKNRATEEQSAIPGVRRIATGMNPRGAETAQASWEENGPVNVVQTSFEKRRITTIEVPPGTAQRLSTGSHPAPEVPDAARNTRLPPTADATAAPDRPAPREESRLGARRESPWNTFRPVAETRNPSETGSGTR